MINASPVRWANWTLVREYLVRARPTLLPSVLVVSLPGSGSSWVGETLGNASNAAYLREPMSQNHFARGGREAVFTVDATTPVAYRQDTAAAFRAMPGFPKNIVIWPEQWQARQRRRRRLVVKEVNPLACGWLIEHFQPRVVFLVRHPMAVAARAHRLGFWPGPGLEVWREQGQFQASTLRRAWDSLETYADKRVVLYEDLCADPVRQFRDLAEFSELTWDAHLEQRIHATTEGGDRSQPYATQRDSRSMIGTWRAEVSPEQLAQFRAGYCSLDLPWYQTDADW